MGIFDNIAHGFELAFSWWNLLYCVIGITVGLVIGALPGLGAVTAISMLLPFTFSFDPLSALIMLSGIFYGALYGGSTASILLNLPGTPANAVTALEGNALAKQGRAAMPLFMATVSSFCGAIIALIFVSIAAPAIVSIALDFGPPEYFSMMLLGLIAASAVAADSLLRSIGMVVVGLLAGLIGLDIVSGSMRYTFGIPMLAEGLSFIVVAMALFGLSEVISNLEPNTRMDVLKPKTGLRDMLPTRNEARRSIGSILRGTALGGFLGALPGAGPTISSFMAYTVERRVSSNPEQFGKGAIEGVAGPEAANNSAAQTGFIPTLTLGIPGDAVQALILGSLIIHGIQPGPLVMTRTPDLFWGLIASMWIGNIMILAINIPFIGIWVRMLSIPYRLFYPPIIIFLCIGVFSVSNSTFNLYLMAGLGCAGYLLTKLNCPASPLLLGLILGPMMEENLRRSLLLSRGDPMIFIESPISAGILVCCALFLAFTIFSQIRSRRRGGPHDVA